MHRQILQVVANALTHRSDPSNIPDITGMDGIPAQDLQEYKSRTHPTTTQPQPILPPNIALLKQFRPAVKTDVTPAKRAKIDTPLGAETLQAQLAEFQKKKAQQEIQDLQKQGILFPPGLPAHSALSLFAFRTAPPGTGPFAARSPIPHAASTTDIKDGKSDVPVTTAALSSQSSINNSASSASASPKFVSKSVLSLAISADGDDRPAPPPSLKFTKFDTVLSLSPPTPAPLAPGQEFHTPSPMSSVPNANTVANVGGQGSPTPLPNSNVSGGGFTGNIGIGGHGGKGARGGGRGRGFGQPGGRGFNRGNGQPGRGGNYPYPYQPPPPMTPPAPFPNAGRGQFQPQYRPGQQPGSSSTSLRNSYIPTSASISPANGKSTSNARLSTTTIPSTTISIPRPSAIPRTAPSILCLSTSVYPSTSSNQCPSYSLCPVRTIIPYAREKGL